MDAAGLIVRVGSDISGAMRGLGAVDARMHESSAAGAAMGKALKVGAALAGAGMIYAAKSAMDFGEQMRLIQTQAGGTSKDVDVLSKAVLGLAKHSAQGPDKLAKSLFHLKSVGMTNVDAMKALRVASDGATTGMADMEQLTNVLAGTWKTNIKGAGDFKNTMAVLNGIVGSGNLRMEDLTAALSTGVLPVVASAGLSIQDFGAALATATAQGIPAEQFATRFKTSLAMLVHPSKQAEAALNSVGLSSKTLAEDFQKPQGLQVALHALKGHFDRIKDPAARFRAELAAFGGVRGSAGIMSLLRGIDGLDQAYHRISKSQKDYNKSVEAAKAEPLNKLKTAWSGIQAQLITLGTKALPVIGKMADFAGRLATKIGSIAHSLSPVIDKLGGWENVLKGLGLAFAAIKVGKLLGLVGPLGSASTAAGRLRGGLLGISQIRFVGLVGAIAGIGYVLTHTKEIGDRVKSTLDSIGHAMTKTGIQDLTPPGQNPLAGIQRQIDAARKLRGFTAEMPIRVKGIWYGYDGSPLAGYVQREMNTAVKKGLGVKGLYTAHEVKIAAGVDASQLIPKVSKAIGEAVSKGAATGGQKAHEAGRAITQGFARGTAAIAPAVQANTAKWLSAISSYAGRFHAAGNRVGAGAAAGAKAGAAAIAPAMNAASAAGAASIAKHAPAAHAGGAKVGQAGSAGAKAGLQKMPADVGSAVSKGAAGMNKGAGPMRAGGQRLGRAGVEGTKAGLNPLPAGVTAAVARGASAARAQIGAYSAAGSALGSALRAGVSGALSGLAGELASQVTAAIGAAKSAAGSYAGIHSPSTLYRDKIGIPLGQGVVSGFAAAARKLSGQVVRDIGAAVARARGFTVYYYAAGKALGDAFSRGLRTGVRAGLSSVGDKLSSVNQPYYPTDSSALSQPPGTKSRSDLNSEIEATTNDITNLGRSIEDLTNDIEDTSYDLGQARAQLAADQAGTVGEGENDRFRTQADKDAAIHADQQRIRDDELRLSRDRETLAADRAQLASDRVLLDKDRALLAAIPPGYEYPSGSPENPAVVDRPPRGPHPPGFRALHNIAEGWSPQTPTVSINFHAGAIKVEGNIATEDQFADRLTPKIQNNLAAYLRRNGFVLA